MPKILLTLFIFLITLLGLLFLALPKYKELNVLRAKEERQQIELAEIENYFSNLRQVSQQLDKHQRSLSKIDMALPEEPEVARLLSFLAQSAEREGLLLIEVGSITTFQEEPRGAEQGLVDPAAEEERMVLKITSFPLRLSGSYPSFRNFLGLLEKSARLIEIERVSFSSIKAGFLQFDFRLRVHSY